MIHPLLKTSSEQDISKLSTEQLIDLVHSDSFDSQGDDIVRSRLRGYWPLDYRDYEVAEYWVMGFCEDSEASLHELTPLYWVTKVVVNKDKQDPNHRVSAQILHESYSKEFDNEPDAVIYFASLGRE